MRRLLQRYHVASNCRGSLTRRDSIHVGAPGGEPAMRRLLIPYISCIRHILPSEQEKLTLRGIDHRRPLRMMDGIDQRRAGSTAVDPYGCGGFITVDDAGSTTVDPYG